MMRIASQAGNKSNLHKGQYYNNIIASVGIEPEVSGVISKRWRRSKELKKLITEHQLKHKQVKLIVDITGEMSKKGVYRGKELELICVIADKDLFEEAYRLAGGEGKPYTTCKSYEVFGKGGLMFIHHKKVQLAQALGVSISYLEKILRKLKREGIIQDRQDSRGVYRRVEIDGLCAKAYELWIKKLPGWEHELIEGKFIAKFTVDEIMKVIPELANEELSWHDYRNAGSLIKEIIERAKECLKGMVKKGVDTAEEMLAKLKEHIRMYVRRAQEKHERRQNKEFKKREKKGEEMNEEKITWRYILNTRVRRSVFKEWMKVAVETVKAGVRSDEKNMEAGEAQIGVLEGRGEERERSIMLRRNILKGLMRKGSPGLYLSRLGDLVDISYEEEQAEDGEDRRVFNVSTRGSKFVEDRIRDNVVLMDVLKEEVKALNEGSLHSYELKLNGEPVYIRKNAEVFSGEDIGTKLAGLADYFAESLKHHSANIKAKACYVT